MIRPTGIRVSGAALRRMLGLPDGPPELVTGVTLDSRRVRPGDLYAALPGFTTHGARFAEMAQSAGAAAILTDPSGAELIGAAHNVEVPVLVVDDPRGVLGAVSAWVYGDPAGALATTGITGTNGKTTVSYLLDAALRAGGHTTGVIGTVATHIGDEVLPATRTTPEASDLHALLAVMRERGASAVTLEVSSHALELGRVDGVHFDLAVFTNLTQDHLDFHGTMEAYYAAKAQLFTAERAAAGLVCVDDAWGRRLADGVGHPGHDLRPGRPGGLDGHRCGPWRPGDDDLRRAWTRCRGACPGGPAGDVQRCQRAGGTGSGRPPRCRSHVAATAIGDCAGVPGRMERIRAGQAFLVLVDYAHTPDAVGRAIAAAREAVTGDVIVVLGCGGDRDRDKRPLMGEVAARGADVLIITDDNPRAEPPSLIRAAIMEGARRVPSADRAVVHDEGDRRDAIIRAVRSAGPSDCVLLLGKGHEQGQEAAGVVTPFDDRLVVREALEALA